MPDLKLGLLPPRPDRPSLELADLFGGKLPTPPTSWDATQGITDWGMLGNATAGDCVVAGYLHQCMIYEKIATGQVPAFTDAEALALYTQLTGWNPDVPGSDTGLNVEDFLTLATQRKLVGQRLKTFAPVRLRTVEHMKVAIWLFDGVNTGVVLPYNAQDQFGAGQPWTISYTTFDHPPLGGHDVPAVKYDADGPVYLTWAAEQQASWLWMEGCTQTADILIPTEIDALTKALDNGYEPKALEAFLGKI